MIIKASSPCRISLFGGGTDIPEYADKNGGLVISFATNLRQHLKLYTDEDVNLIPRNQIPYLGDINFMHTIFEQFKTGTKFGGFHEVHFESESDALLNSGLGASAAAAVATIGAMSKARGIEMSKEQIAEMAWDVEVNKIGLFGGRQDQYASAFGGFNAIIFSKNQVDIQGLNQEIIERLLPNLVLIHTGFTRENPKIQEGFKELSTEQEYHLDQIKSIAQDALQPLAEGDIEKVGSLLDEAWELKKQSNKGVTNGKLEMIYEGCMRNGAYGGKTLGAGGGGYMLFVVDADKRERFIEKAGLEQVQVDFSPDWNGLEVRVL